MRVLCTIENKGAEPEVVYALRALCRIGGLQPVFCESPSDPARPEVAIHYGARPPRPNRPCVWIRASPAFPGGPGTTGPPPREPWGSLEGLPVLIGPAREPPAVDRFEGGWIFNADIVASAFFLMSGREEDSSAERDEHGRFLSRHSILARAGSLQVPVVDRYARFLAETVSSLAGRSLIPPSSWDGEGFALVISHDVDSLRRPRRASGGAGGSAHARRSAAPLTSIFEVEARAGVQATYFFLTRREDPVRERYTLDDPEADRAVGDVLARGAEVGLHGSYGCLYEPGALEVEAALLRRRVPDAEGFRQHYLRLPRSSLGRVRDSGFRYDTSLGWPDALGFRHGTAHPFFPWDFARRRPVDLVEIPLAAMDRTLEKYLGLDARAARDPLFRILSEAKLSRGCAAILWHHEFFDSVKHPGFAELYEEVLRWLAACGARALTGRRAAAAYRARCGVSLDPEEDFPSS